MDKLRNFPVIITTRGVLSQAKMDPSSGISSSLGGILLNDVVDEFVPMTPTDTSSDTGDVDQFKKYVEAKEQQNRPLTAEEADMSVFNFEDSYVTTDGGGRSLRRRTSKPDFKNFLENFDPGNSEREIRKRKKKLAHRARGRGAIYDSQGLLIATKKDLCDCMEEPCPGCHFPCVKCQSNKCGHECRQNRKWMFDSAELDGVPGSQRSNPNIVSAK